MEQSYRFTLITGACGGLGSAFCEELASRGEPLFLTGRSEAVLRARAEDLRARYPALEVRFRAADLADEESRLALLGELSTQGIGLKRLVYVAGIDTQMALGRYDEARVVAQCRVNLEGAVSLLRGALSLSALDGNTELLAVGSMSGVSPMPYFALYSATKKALEQVCAGLHEELRGRAKVTCVLPGSIPTRDDIKENIRSHGFIGRLSAKSPRAVAVASLKAVRRNRRRKIVGGWNHLIYLCSVLCPTSLRMRFIARMWKRTEKDFYGGPPAAQ